MQVKSVSTLTSAQSSPKDVAYEGVHGKLYHPCDCSEAVLLRTTKQIPCIPYVRLTFSKSVYAR